MCRRDFFFLVCTSAHKILCSLTIRISFRCQDHADEDRPAGFFVLLYRWVLNCLLKLDFRENFHASPSFLTLLCLENC